MAEQPLCVLDEAVAGLDGIYSASKSPEIILASTEGSGRK